MPTCSNSTQFALIADFDTFLRCLESKSNLWLTSADEPKSADLWAFNERVNNKASDYVTNRSQ